jgi:hypothetical protein
MSVAIKIAKTQASALAIDNTELVNIEQRTKSAVGRCLLVEEFLGSLLRQHFRIDLDLAQQVVVGQLIAEGVALLVTIHGEQPVGDEGMEHVVEQTRLGSQGACKVVVDAADAATIAGDKLHEQAARQFTSGLAGQGAGEDTA